MPSLGSVMGIFQRTQPTGPRTPGAPTPGGTVETNPTVPSDANKITAQPGAGSGLDKFGELWKAPTGADGKPTEKLNPSMIPPLNVDVGKLTEAAAKLDFAGSISDDQITKAFGVQADKEAIKAVLNSVGRSGWVQGTASTAEITKQSLTHAQAALTGSVLPDAVRDATITDAVNKENPIFSNPAAAPMLVAVRDQLMLKYPQASPAEISKMAGEYVSGFARTVVSGEGATIVEKPTPGEGSMLNRPKTNWEQYFGVNIDEQGNIRQRA